MVGGRLIVHVSLFEMLSCISDSRDCGEMREQHLYRDLHELIAFRIEIGYWDENREGKSDIGDQAL